VFSSLYFGLKPPEEQNSGGSRNFELEQYEVVQAGDNAVLFLASARLEVVALPGNNARLNEDSLASLMNLSTPSVSYVKGEVAGNSFMLFRFTVSDIDMGVSELTPKLNTLLRDYKLYRGYIATMPGDKTMTNQVYLLGPLNLSQGMLVNTLVFEKKSLDGSQRLGLIGFVKNEVAVGPIVDATVNGIDGSIVSGIVQGVLSDDELKGSFPEADGISLQPMSASIDGVVSKEELGLEGVELLNHVNNTIVRQVNNTREEIIASIERLGMNYTINEGSLSISFKRDVDIKPIEQRLGGMNVENVTSKKYGRITLPEDVLIEDKVVPIDNNRNFTAMLFANATEGQKIKAEVSVLELGGQYLVNAKQV
jgi:hypothetical protein